MNTKIYSATVIGLKTHQVIVEVDVDKESANTQIFIVGLASTSIQESKRRVISALKNCGFILPSRKITINLSPADLRKEGALFDLPIALGILQACGALSIPEKVLKETIIVGELSLDGTVNPIKGSD